MIDSIERAFLLVYGALPYMNVNYKNVLGEIHECELFYTLVL